MDGGNDYAGRSGIHLTRQAGHSEMGVSLFPAGIFTLPWTATPFNHFSERGEINFDFKSSPFPDSTILWVRFFPRRSLRGKYPTVENNSQNHIDMHLYDDIMTHRLQSM